MSAIYRYVKIFLLVVVGLTDSASYAQTQPAVSWWLTDGDRSALLARQPAPAARAGAGPVIRIDAKKKYQRIDGFGFCLTDGSASLIDRLPQARKAALLRELFTGKGIGISYLRVSIGASDLSDSVFTYDDLPPCETDTAMKRFSLAQNRVHLIPLLKKIRALQPGLRILGSPWTAPVWMKTNGSSAGGSLKPEYRAAYARYFVKYIQGMKAAGIPIDAITPQNEPMNPKNNPSLVFTAEEEADFIKNYLGPAFRAAGLKTKILIFDHNCGDPQYPLAILGDKVALPYIDGTAFHLYSGDISALSQIHEAAPAKNVYFTEQWVGGPGNFPEDFKWAVKNLVVGAPRNWSRTVLEWNLASDPEYKPHTVGGCDRCQGALTIGPDSISRNTSYYIIGQAAKFVPRGSVRIGSDSVDGLPNVAFLRPDGKRALIVLNDGASEKEFTVREAARDFHVALKAGSAATFVW